jgi:Ca2+-binding EF-hand superfamily protein
MKFTKTLIQTLIITLLIGVIISRTSRRSNEVNPAQQWASLFSQARDPNCGQKDGMSGANLALDDGSGGVSWNGPKKKVNEWDKQNGYGPSAYLFDFLDDVFQADISKEFTRLYDEAKKLPLPDVKEQADPYSLDKMVSMLAQPSTNDVAASATTTPTASNPNDQSLIDKLKKIVSSNTKVFNEGAFKAGLTVPQVYALVKAWNWYYNPAEIDFARKILDKFDFDGDGRLNPREFIVFSIIHNKNNLGGGCKNCYNDIISNKIDPIYSFIDCDNDNKVSAEDMWGNLQNLKRLNSAKSNIYQCLLNSKKYRTTSMNDFVLKNMWDNDGFVSRNEFRVGILLGYWDRQTDPEKIYTDDTRTFKKLRWGETGTVDVVCSRILAAQNPSTSPATNSVQGSNPSAGGTVAKSFRR